jgi:uncharacterized membrane protein
MIGTFLTWGYILLALAAIAAIGLPLIYMIQNPQMLKKTLLYVGLLLVVAIISYLLASDSPVVTTNHPTSGELKWTDAGIIAMYICLLAAILSIFVCGIVNMIRNR